MGIIRRPISWSTHPRMTQSWFYHVAYSPRIAFFSKEDSPHELPSISLMITGNIHGFFYMFPEIILNQCIDTSPMLVIPCTTVTLQWYLGISLGFICPPPFSMLFGDLPRYRTFSWPKVLGAHGHEAIDVEGQEAPSPTRMISLSCGMLMKCALYIMWLW